MLIDFIYQVKSQNLIQDTNTTQEDTLFPITILICFKNEAKRIQPLLESFSKLSYPQLYIEYIFCNDHSIDASESIIREFLKDKKGKIIRNGPDEYGKKIAQMAGVYAAQNNLILQTDADCVVPPHWVQHHIRLYLNKSTLKASFGAIKLNHKKHNLLTHWQHIEAIALNASSHALIHLGIPAMCSGANMSFKREAFLNTIPIRKDLKILSGDDIYLMQSIAKIYGMNAITYNLCTETLVETQAENDLKKFIAQRTRWAKKWNANQPIVVRLTAMYIFTVNISTCFLLYYSLILIYAAIFICTFRWLLEGYLIHIAAKRLQLKVNSFYLISLFLLYPLYVTGIALFTLKFKYPNKNK